MMDVTVYKRPDGRTEVVTITKVHADDAKWFKDNRVAVSMEDIGGDYAIYADTGKELDGEPDEFIEIANGRSCEETLKSLRKQCEGESK
jgi:hypothetical protein